MANTFRPKLVKVEVLVNDTWVVKRFEKIQKGDIFRTYNKDDETILNRDSEGHTVFKATRDSHSESGFDYQIDCVPYTEFTPD